MNVTPSTSRTLAEYHTQVFGGHAGSCFGGLTEWNVFRQLEISGAPVVRGEEHASCDGALFTTASDALPPAGASPTELNRWALNTSNHGTRFVTFDVKYGSYSQRRNLSSAAPEEMSTRYEALIVPEAEKKHKPEFYIYQVGDDSELFAIIPCSVLASHTGASSFRAWGLNSLISKLPPWVTPYVVERKDLLLAMQSILDAAADPGDPETGTRTYVNPSNGIELTGWHPTMITDPEPLFTWQASKVSSNKAIERLRQRLVSHDIMIEFHYNPVAPLVADFLLKIPGVPTYLAIEHKYYTGQNPALSTINANGPFSSGRQWHFLIWQRGANEFLCFARDQVPSRTGDGKIQWKDSSLNSIRFRGDAGLVRMVDYMRRNSRSAVRAGLFAMRSSRFEDMVVSNNAQPNLPADDEDTFRTRLLARPGHAAPRRADRLSRNPLIGEIDDELEARGVDPNSRNRGLRMYELNQFWLTELFNRLACHHRRGAFLPNDAAHGLGNYAIVDHHWTTKDVEEFKRDGSLPVYLFSSHAQDNITIPLLLIEMHRNHKRSDANDTEGIYMHYSTWTRKKTLQDFIIIAGIADPQELVQEPTSYPYLFLPSEFTTWPRRPGATSPLQHTTEDWQHNHFPKYVAVDEQVTTKRNTHFRIGSEHLQPGINPDRFFQSIEGMYRHLINLLNSRPEDTVVIENPSSYIENPGALAGRYQIQLRDLSRASLNYGLPRRYQTKNPTQAALKRASVASFFPLRCPVSGCSIVTKTVQSFSSHFTSMHRGVDKEDMDLDPRIKERIGVKAAGRHAQDRRNGKYVLGRNS